MVDGSGKMVDFALVGVFTNKFLSIVDYKTKQRCKGKNSIFRITIYFLIV